MMEEVVAGLKSIYAKYPKWMDKANYSQTQIFKKIVNNAKILALQKTHDHHWLIKARGVLREYHILYGDVIHD